MNKRILNVSDLSSYIYCPRKFYLEKIKGIKSPPSRAMIEGRIRHEVFEKFGKNEESFVRANNMEHFSEEEIKKLYKNYVNMIISEVIESNKEIIFNFKIEEFELVKKILDSFSKEINLRADSLAKTIRKGFKGDEIWENLSPKYYSELNVLSEEIGLKGRVDRVMEEGNKIIPFELKTRSDEKVYFSDEIQVCAYAMMLEEIYNVSIGSGIVEAGNQRYEVLVDDAKRKKVLEIINEILNLNSENAKYPSNFSKCEKCFFKKICENPESI